MKGIPFDDALATLPVEQSSRFISYLVDHEFAKLRENESNIIFHPLNLPQNHIC